MANFSDSGNQGAAFAVAKLFSADDNIHLEKKEEAIAFLGGCIDKYNLGEFMQECSEGENFIFKRTFDRSMSAATVAVDIGLGKHLSDERLRGLAIGVVLHDIGKLDLPDAPAILNKPDSLTEEQKNIMATHSALGLTKLMSDSRLAAVAELPYVKEIVVSNHAFRTKPYPFDLGNKKDLPEKFMGLNIAGWDDEMFETVAIAACSDIFDALSHNRPYRHACKTRPEMLAIMTESTNLPRELLTAAASRFGRD